VFLKLVSQTSTNVNTKAAADDPSSDDNSDLTDMLSGARNLLNSSRFDEAETAFLKLYNEIQVTNVCYKIKQQ